ncbi:MAG: hypothetical protein U0531_13070 [Dehalococcoidia bacterium]
MEALDLHDDLTMPALSRAATAAWYTYGARRSRRRSVAGGGRFIGE